MTALPPHMRRALTVSIVSIVSTAALGAFVGYAVRSEPNAVVATVLLLVGLFDLLGAAQYAVDRAGYDAEDRKITVYETARTKAKGPEARRYEEKIENSQIKKAEFIGAWKLLPHLIVTTFGVAMAATAYASTWRLSCGAAGSW